MMGELGTYAAARERRTVGDSGASSNRPNGCIVPEAVRRRVCDAGMCRNVIYFHKHHQVPPY